MVSIGIAAALTSAGLQAGAHALTKGGDDKLIVRGLVGATCLLMSLPFLLLVPLPDTTMWLWLALSTGVHAVYQLTLIKAYELGDFSITYPVARGVAPIGAAAGAMLLMGERLPLPAIAGVAFVSAGILSFIAGEKTELKALAAALATGFLIIAYTLVDARGVRAGSGTWSFVPWFFLMDGVTMMTLTATLRGQRLADGIRANFRQGAAAGIASAATYTLALVALKLAPVGAASALRETSVVYGLIIARFCLGEKVGVKRLIAGSTICVGSLLVAASLR